MKTNSKNYNREISSSALAFRSMLSGYFFLFIYSIFIYILYTFFFSSTALLFYKRARLFYAVIKCITLETLNTNLASCFWRGAYVFFILFYFINYFTDVINVGKTNSINSHIELHYME